MSEPVVGTVEVVPDEIADLSPVELAELGSQPDNLEAVRAEVCRRLGSDPRKPNLLTFRWLLPANDDDQIDAKDGLMAVCWKQVQMRHALDPRRFEPRTRRNAWEVTREAIWTELVNCLYEFKDLTRTEIIKHALDGKFSRVAVDVANAVRRQLWAFKKFRSLDPVSEVEKLGVPSSPDWRGPETVMIVAGIIARHEAELKNLLGKSGYQVLCIIVEMVREDVMPEKERACDRAITQAIGARRGVGDRQARHDKKHFLESVQRGLRGGDPALKEIYSLLHLNRHFREIVWHGKGW